MTRARLVVEAKGLVHAERYTSSGDVVHVDCRATSDVRPRSLRWPASAALQLGPQAACSRQPYNYIVAVSNQNRTVLYLSHILRNLSALCTAFKAIQFA